MKSAANNTKGRNEMSNLKKSNLHFMRKGNGFDPSKRWHCKYIDWLIAGSNCGKTFSPNDVAILQAIVSSISDGGEYDFRPSTIGGVLAQEYIARRSYGCSVQTVRRSSVKLESLGILKRSPVRSAKSRARTHYEVNVDKIYQLLDKWGPVEVDLPGFNAWTDISEERSE